MIIRFTPQADTELAEARDWYAHQREDLDLEFMKSIATRDHRVTQAYYRRVALTVDCLYSLGIR